jgi:hypothetical protein
MTVTAVAAGCGGSDSSNAQTYSVEASTVITTASIGKPQFVPRVNKICREAWVEILDNWAEYSSWQDPKESARKRFSEAVQLSLLAGIDFHIFDEILNLGAPKGEEREVEEIVGPMQIAVELGQKLRPSLYSVAEVSEHFDEYNQRAQRYGLDDCLVNEAHLSQIEA